MAKQFIRYERKGNNEYASVCLPKRIKGKKVNQMTYLGRVLDKENSLFSNRKQGTFKYTLEGGFEPVSASYHISKIPVSEAELLDFGDSHFLFSFLQKTPYYGILENMAPGVSDTFFSLLAYHILSPGPLEYVQPWWYGNFVKHLFPKAELDTEGISALLEYLGSTEIQNRFFTAYFGKLSQEKDIHGILVDVPSQNQKSDCNTFFSSSSDLFPSRLLYVAERSSGLPLYFSYGLDSVSDLVQPMAKTISILHKYGIATDFTIPDNRQLPETLLSLLHKEAIAYITDLVPGSSLFREIVDSYSSKTYGPENIVTYGMKQYFIKKIPYLFGDGIPVYAYLTLANNQTMPTGYKQKEKINHTCEGTSVFVSSADLPIDQVLPLFCTKNKANKDFGMLTGFPVGNSLQAIKGQFLVLFIASMITSLLDKEFSSQGLDIGRIFHELRNQKCTVSNGYAIPGKTLNTIDYRYRSLLVDQPFLISP